MFYNNDISASTRQWSEDTADSDQYHTDSSNRPKITVEPRGIGPVTDLHENDVLCGRGGRVNGHCGNIQFRQMCGEKRREYFRKGIKKIEKAHIAASVVDRIRNLSPPGRFLKQEGSTGQWYDIGCAKAMTKVGQAIREHTPKVDMTTTARPGDEFSSNPFGQPAASKPTTPQLSFNNGQPLYPGYQPIQVPSSQQQQQQQQQLQPQQPDLLSTAPLWSVANTASNTRPLMEEMEEPEHAFGRDFQPAAVDKRMSTFSAMSGMSGMSDLMRGSVQSDAMRASIQSELSSTVDPMAELVDGMMSPPRSSSLLRESVLSDISDTMSTMSLNDEGLSRLSVMDDSLLDRPSILSRPSKLRFDGLRGSSGSMARPSDAFKWGQRRQTRKSSVFSLSMLSTLSSVGSMTSFNMD